jgi:hypothetical protein
MSGSKFRQQKARLALALVFKPWRKFVGLKVQHTTSPAGTNDNDSFDMAADPALGRGDFDDFAIQHSWYLHGRAIWLLN